MKRSRKQRTLNKNRDKKPQRTFKKTSKRRSLKENRRNVQKRTRRKHIRVQKRRHKLYGGAAPAGAEVPAGAAAPAGAEMIDLPAAFESGGKFKVVPHLTGRSFGRFQEKTLVVDALGKKSIDDLCYDKFTQGYEGGKEWDPRSADPDEDGNYRMKKIPVIILIHIIENKYEDSATDDYVEKELVGAFPICMKPDKRTAMNVIVGRYRYNAADDVRKYPVKKFSLYYPDNTKYNNNDDKIWPLLHGFAFRTGIFGNIATGREKINDPIFTNLGIIIDDESIYEDTMYWESEPSEDDLSRFERIKGTVEKMTGELKDILTLSYNPELAAEGKTCAQEEFEIFAEIHQEEDDGAGTGLPSAAAPTTDGTPAPAAEGVVSDMDIEVVKAFQAVLENELTTRTISRAKKIDATAQELDKEKVIGEDPKGDEMVDLEEHSGEKPTGVTRDFIIPDGEQVGGSKVIGGSVGGGNGLEELKDKVYAAKSSIQKLQTTFAGDDHEFNDVRGFVSSIKDKHSSYADKDIFKILTQKTEGSEEWIPVKESELLPPILIMDFMKEGMEGSETDEPESESDEPESDDDKNIERLLMKINKGVGKKITIDEYSTKAEEAKIDLLSGTINNKAPKLYLVPVNVNDKSCPYYRGSQSPVEGSPNIPSACIIPKGGKSLENLQKNIIDGFSHLYFIIDYHEGEGEDDKWILLYSTLFGKGDRVFWIKWKIDGQFKPRILYGSELPDDDGNIYNKLNKLNNDTKGIMENLDDLKSEVNSISPDQKTEDEIMEKQKVYKKIITAYKHLHVIRTTLYKIKKMAFGWTNIKQIINERVSRIILPPPSHGGSPSILPREYEYFFRCRWILLMVREGGVKCLIEKYQDALRTEAIEKVNLTTFHLLSVEDYSNYLYNILWAVVKDPPSDNMIMHNLEKYITMSYINGLDKSCNISLKSKEAVYLLKMFNYINPVINAIDKNSLIEAMKDEAGDSEEQ